MLLAISPNVSPDGSKRLPPRAPTVLAGLAFALMVGNAVAAEPIKVGTMQSLTGAAESYGTVFTQSIQLAVDDINAAGGINGRQVELIVEDSKCSGPDAVTAYTKLVKVDKVPVIFGSTCSGEFLAVADRFDSDKVIGMANVSHPEVATGHPFIFRNGPTTESGGKILAASILASGYKSMATVTQETDFAEGLRHSLVKYFKAGGGSVVQEERVRVEETDFKPIITRVLAKKPSAIFAAMQNEEGCGTFVRQVRDLGFTGALYGGTPCTGGLSVEIGGDAITGLRSYQAPFISDDSSKGIDFLTRYKAKYGVTSEEFFMAAAYDEVFIIKHCAEKVGSIENTEGLRQCINDLVDFEGTIGTYHFDDEGEIVGIEPFMVEVLPPKEREVSPLSYKVLEE